MDSDIEEAYRDVPALVLGGSGFIGAWTVRALHARGAGVIITTRDPVRASSRLGALAGRIRIRQASLEDRAAVDRLLADVRPAIVFNLAGYGVDPAERDPAAMAALNARAVSDLCDRLAGEPEPGWKGLRLVHAGSALEYGAVQGTLHEDMMVDPTTDYGRTKLTATRAIQARAASGLPSVVARLFTVYGPGEHPHRLLPALLRTAGTLEPLPLTAGRQPRDFTYVGDVAEGLLRLGACSGLGEVVVNLATGQLTSVREFAETAARVLGFDAALLEFGALPDRHEEMWHGKVDVVRLRARVGWVPPTPIADGIRRTREITGVG